jgi:hypothetical protein
MAHKRTAIFILIFMVSLVHHPSALQGQTGPAFLDVSAIGGGWLKPGGQSLAGFGVGVGKGRNQVSMEASREFLSSYQLGVGESIDPITALPNRPGSYLVASSAPDSVVESLGGNFRRDFRGTKRGQMVYGLAGIGYVRSRSNPAVFGVPLTTLFPNDAPFLVAAYQASPTVFIPVTTRVKTVGLSFGGGVRVPLAKGFGIRGELRARWNHGSGSSYSSPVVPIRDANGNPIVLSSGFAYRVGLTSSVGPRLKSDTFLGMTFGIYYRIFNRHV